MPGLWAGKSLDKEVEGERFPISKVLTSHNDKFWFFVSPDIIVSDCVAPGAARQEGEHQHHGQPGQVWGGRQQHNSIGEWKILWKTEQIYEFNIACKIGIVVEIGLDIHLLLGWVYIAQDKLLSPLQCSVKNWTMMEFMGVTASWVDWRIQWLDVGSHCVWTVRQ